MSLKRFWAPSIPILGVRSDPVASRFCVKMALGSGMATKLAAPAVSAAPESMAEGPLSSFLGWPGLAFWSTSARIRVDIGQDYGWKVARNLDRHVRC